MNAIELLNKLMNAPQSVFCADENAEGTFYYPLYRDRGDAPFSPERIQECWKSAREFNENMEDVFTRDILETAWDTSFIRNDLYAAFTRAIGEEAITGNPVEIPEGFDFWDWYSENVTDRVFPDEWKHDEYGVSIYTGETLASFMKKHPEIDLNAALKQVYADAERDADETIFYVANIDAGDLWELSDMVANGAGAVEASNIRLGEDDLPILVKTQIPVHDILEVSIEVYDRTGKDAVLKSGAPDEMRLAA